MKKININRDEMMGFIIRTASEEDGVMLSYDDVESVLNAQMKFYGEKGLVEEVDEIRTKDGVVSNRVAVTALSVDGSPIFFDDDLQCVITNPGELTIKGIMGPDLYNEIRDGVLKGTKHSYKISLSNGRITSGYLCFTGNELLPGVPEELTKVKVTAEIVK